MYGSSSPSENRGELALPSQKQNFCFSVLQFCSSKQINCAAISVLLYTLTQPLIVMYTPLTQQCTPRSATVGSILLSQGCICQDIHLGDAFDPPMPIVYIIPYLPAFKSFSTQHAPPFPVH